MADEDPGVAGDEWPGGAELTDAGRGFFEGDIRAVTGFVGFVVLNLVGAEGEDSELTTGAAVDEGSAFGGVGVGDKVRG